MASNGTASTSSLFDSSASPAASSSSSPSVAPTEPRPSPTESFAAPSSPPATPNPSDSTPPPSDTQTDPSSSAEPTSAAPPPPSSSTPVSLPPSSSDEPSSTPPPSSAPPSTPSPTPTPSSKPPEPSSDIPTSVVTAPSKPPTTIVSTSVVTPTPTRPGEPTVPSTVVLTITNPGSDQSQPSDSAGPASSSKSTSPAGLQNVNKGADGGSGGLSSGGKIGIAVAVPVVVVALLVFAGILFWRKRKQRKHAEEARRKEVEEYGFNPNHDPTLPAVGIASEMGEDQSGYRGWGNTTTSSNRKASTTLTSGMTYSDSTSNPGGGPHSPTQADAQSNDALMNGRRETLDAEGFGAMGAMGNNYNQNGQSGVHRGPSNASSSYSAAGHSDASGDYPIPMSNPQDYYDQHNTYYHPTQYEAYSDPYAGQPQPIIRDVPARRNTRIESPSVFPPQGNSGIAQNF